jgi:hypothetical protein
MMIQSDNPAGFDKQSGTPLGDKAQALNAIAELESSEEYMKLVMERGHLNATDSARKAELLQRRNDFYKVAYEGDE